MLFYAYNSLNLFFSTSLRIAFARSWCLRAHLKAERFIIFLFLYYFCVRFAIHLFVCAAMSHFADENSSGDLLWVTDESGWESFWRIYEEICFMNSWNRNENSKNAAEVEKVELLWLGSHTNSKCAKKIKFILKIV